jgi:uncharacterized membrane protein (UPF0127 family)
MKDGFEPIKISKGDLVLDLNAYEATSGKARRQGLIDAPKNASLLLPYCPLIHMCGMKRSLDIVFLNKEGLVRVVYENVKPGFRLRGSLAVRCLEMPAGSIKLFDIRLGNQLTIS